MTPSGPPFDPHDEYASSRRQLATQAWPVAPDYAIADGHVRPLYQVLGPAAADGRTYYWPFGRPELPAEFAKVADERDATLLEFVRRYGLLGSDPSSPAGDPLRWVFAHARNVHLALAIADASSDRSAAADRQIADVLDRFAVATDDGTWIVVRGGDGPASRIPRGDMQHPRELARRVLAEAITPNLARVHRVLFAEPSQTFGEIVFRKPEPRTPSGLSLEWSSPDLMGVVYWHLAEAVLGNRVRRCAYDKCRRPFVASNERMKFCPAPLGNLSVSPCMNRDKVARARRTKVVPSAAPAAAKGPKSKTRTRGGRK